MNLSDFSLLKEDGDKYHVGHPSGKSIEVPKKGLSDKAHKLIKNLKPMHNYADGTPDEPIQASQMPTAEPTPQQQEQEIMSDVSQQSPAAPNTNQMELGQPAVPPAGSPPVSAPGVDMGQTLQEERAALKGGEEAEQKLGQAQQEAYGGLGKEFKDLNAGLQQRMQARQQKLDALEKAYQSGKIDPNRYMNNMDTGAKITSSIAMMLGGMGAGLTGGPNLAYQHLQNAINQDIEAQKNDQSKVANLWKMNREAEGDDINATLSTQNQMLAGAKAKMMAAAGGAMGAQAAARLAPQLAQIDSQIAMNHRVQSLMDFQKSGQMTDTDPAQLVPFFVKSPEQQKQVYEEIGRAQNVSRNSDKILEAFDKSAKENTALKTGAGLLRTPGSIMALHQLLLPNFKQIDGTVRQAAMDETFHNVTPQPGDTDAKIAYKKKALMDWMHSETAAPVAKGNGLDLTRFSSTAAKEAAPEVKTMNGVQYKKVPGGWQRIS